MARTVVGGFGGRGVRGRPGSGGVTIHVDTSSLRRVLNNIDVTNKKAIAGFKRAFADEGDKIITLAKEYTPVKTGDLKGSGRKTPPRGVFTEGTRSRPKGFFMFLKFGGNYRGIPVHYALYVHEGFKHFWSGEQIKGRKFLERAVRKLSRGMAGRVAAKVRL